MYVFAIHCWLWINTRSVACWLLWLLKSFSWWRHQMETFPRYMMFSFISTWIKGWVNNRQAGDLRRHSAHYDFTVMNNTFVVMQVRITAVYEQVKYMCYLCYHHPREQTSMQDFARLLAPCEGNPPATGGFPVQRVCNADLEVMGIFYSWSA